MKITKFKFHWLLAGSVFCLAANLAVAQPSDQDKSKEKNKGNNKDQQPRPPASNNQQSKTPSSGNQQSRSPSAGNQSRQEPGYSSGKKGPSSYPSDSPNRPANNSTPSRDSRQPSGASGNASSDRGRPSDPNKQDENNNQKKGQVNRPQQSSGTSQNVSSDHKGSTDPNMQKKGPSDRPQQTSGSGKSPQTATTQGQDNKQASGATKQGPAHAGSSTTKTPPPPPPPPPVLHTKQVANGVEKVTASGQVRERIERKPDGEHTRVIAPTGRVQREVVQKPDGTQHTIHYAANGKDVQRTVVVAKDGTKETTNIQYGRNGKERAAETVRVDVRGREVSKTVVVKQTTVIVQNTTIVNNAPIVRNYDRGHYGFVYRPVYVARAPVFVSWYDPYWYRPSGVVVVHPFHYHWGWDDYGWYHHHRHYWATYDVYPTPAYWMTDWMIANYVADRYAAEASLEQAREEARLAHEDADRARAAAEKSREEAEVAEARAAQREAELRVARAEERAARAEAREALAKSDKPNPNAVPVDNESKEVLRHQIEQAVAEKKEYAEQVAAGKTPVLPDLSRTLADPKHIYPVSTAINVIAASDQSPAGTLTEGDLLKIEPGQEAALQNAEENTFVTMRVMTSKGEEGECRAGTLVSISLKSLQEFDSEFRAKLDLGLAEADKNKDKFKSGAQ